MLPTHAPAPRTKKSLDGLSASEDALTRLGRLYHLANLRFVLAKEFETSDEGEERSTLMS